MRVTLTVLLSITLSSTALAQRAATSTPAAVATTILRALVAGDYQAAAERTNPAELRRNRVAFDSLLAADSGNYIAQRLFRLDNTAQLRRLSDTAFTAGLMRFWFGVNGVTQSLSTVRDIQIAGTATGSADTALVVYRWLFPANIPPYRSYLVEAMVPCGPSWCSTMAADFDGLLRVLKAPMVPVKVRTDTTRRR